MTSADEPPAAGHCPRCGFELSDTARHCPRCPPPGGWLEPPLSLPPDERYEVLGTLGRGGMGVVYKVHDRELDEDIALKVLEPMFGTAPEAVERFKSEIKIARRINHPNVARLYDLFAWKGRLAISMEYIDGEALDERLGLGPLALDRLRRYTRYLCSGLHAAHRLGIVHRDLKPANILVDRSDRPHILDFGIAILGGDRSRDPRNTVFGTPWYMSPEQAYRPDRVDHRSDIYSLGVVLYRMATGEVPFPGSDPQEVFRAHELTAPLAPSDFNPAVPAALDQAILRCLEKDPDRRFASAIEVYRAVEAASGRPEAAQTAGQPPLAVPARPGRVLLVDDDALSRRLVRDRLEQSGVEVCEAADGYQGVEAALNHLPDLVLLDLQMPVLDGREALRILKSNSRTAAIPVIMLTALEDPEEALASKEMGAAVYLNKPVEPDVLDLLIEKYLRPAIDTRERTTS